MHLASFRETNEMYSTDEVRLMENSISMKGRRQTKRPKKKLHWAVKEVFEEADRQGVSLRKLEELVIELTKNSEGGPLRIPFQSMRYWKSGYSDPKISEVEAMAEVLGLEMELYPTRMDHKSRGHAKGGDEDVNERKGDLAL